MSSTPVTPQQARADKVGRARRRIFIRGLNESAVKWVCFACALVSVATTFGIIAVLLGQSIPFFRTVSVKEFFTGTVWQPVMEPPKFGVLPLVCGTLMITVGAGLIAIPLGLLSAIFLSEYAHARVRGILKPVLELLAGIPTVVYGYFALFFVTPLLKRIDANVETYNAAAGAIVVGIMILPLVSSLCEDALAAVPRALREGAYGLGATKMEVITRIVVPSALSGVMASFILALSRALGETMAVALAAGSKPQLTLNPFQSVQTMTAYIVEVTKGDAAYGTVRYNSIFAVGVTLFAFTMVMNIIAARLVRKFRLVYG